MKNLMFPVTFTGSEFDSKFSKEKTRMDNIRASTRTSPDKRLTEQNNGSARPFYVIVHFVATFANHHGRFPSFFLENVSRLQLSFLISIWS